MSVRIMVDLPDDVYRTWELRSRVDGKPVHTLIGELATVSVRERPARGPRSRMPKPVVERLVKLHGEGLSDAAIGRTLRYAPSTIGRYRDHLKLPANHGFGGRHERAGVTA